MCQDTIIITYLPIYLQGNLPHRLLVVDLPSAGVGAEILEIFAKVYIVSVEIDKKHSNQSRTCFVVFIIKINESSTRKWV